MKKCKKPLACVAACMSLVATVLVAGCTPEQQYAVGNFYSLEEAYENGWLTRDDILRIAYYYNQGTEGNEELMGENYAPEPMVPEMLDEERVNQIKRTYLNEVIAMPEGTFEHVIIRAYYGTYGGNIVILRMITTDTTMYLNRSTRLAAFGFITMPAHACVSGAQTRPIRKGRNVVTCADLAAEHGAAVPQAGRRRHGKKCTIVKIISHWQR